jgi:cobaltochelatase CobS
MALVKHSQRTSRKGCERCGTTDVYWAHDTAKLARKDCQDCTKRDGTTVNGAWTLIGRDGLPHILTCSGVKDAATAPVDPAPKQDVTVAHSTAEIPAPATAPAPSGDVATALQTLMAAMAPGVDAEQVKAIVRDEMASVVYPTKTVVVRNDEAPRTVKGATHHKLADVIKILATGEHVLMVGPAGTGKSTIAEQAAEALNLPAYSLSLSPQTSSASVFGYMHATGGYVRTLFREAFEHGGVFNFDEMDNGHPSILAAINGALANGHAAFPDGMVKRNASFRVVGSANTYGRGADRKYVGRQALDAATLDRFTFLTIDIDEALERNLCESTGAGSDTVSKVLTYVKKIRKNVESTGLPVVVSPRASVGLCRLLSAGFSVPDAIDARVRRGLSDQDWTKLTAGVSF